MRGQGRQGRGTRGKGGQGREARPKGKCNFLREVRRVGKRGTGVMREGEG